MRNKDISFWIGIIAYFGFWFYCESRNCNSNNHSFKCSVDEVDQVADVIISKSRKGSIRAEFPSEFYDNTLEEIERWKIQKVNY